MRKCPFCGMVSDKEDVCPWCRRAFDTFYFPQNRSASHSKATAKQKQYFKGAIMVVVIVLALYSLANLKTAPDAAEVSSLPPLSPTAVRPPQATPPPAIRSGAPMPGASIPAPPSNNTYVPPVVSTNAATTSGAGSFPQIAAKNIAKLASVHISTESDNSGTETAVGTITIVNEGSKDITDFQLTLNVNGVRTPLTPFQGALNYPMAFSSRRIPPHGNLQVNVMTTTRYPSSEVGVRNVELEAHFDGDNQAVYDTVPLR